VSTLGHPNAPGLISVIMPCFNAEAFVEESVRSALTQHEVAAELVAIDDGSTDATAEILARLARAFAGRMTVLRTPNRGPYPARNEGLRRARGEFVAFLDADDYWAADALRRLKEALEGSHADVAYCGWQNFGQGAPGTRPYVPPNYLAEDPVAAFLESCPWPIHAALTRRAALEAVGGFSERCYSSMDYDLWLRLMAHTRAIVRVPEVLAHYRWHDRGQISSVKWRQALDAWRVRRDFAASHPDLVRHLHGPRLRELVDGSLRRAAYEAHWRGDATSAQRLFRAMLWGGVIGRRDLKHALGSLLPGPLFRALTDHTGRARASRKAGT
jgi:glycosyltransferase involved in cell wall biosynthesis